MQHLARLRSGIGLLRDAEIRSADAHDRQPVFAGPLHDYGLCIYRGNRKIRLCLLAFRKRRESLRRSNPVICLVADICRDTGEVVIHHMSCIVPPYHGIWQIPGIFVHLFPCRLDKHQVFIRFIVGRNAMVDVSSDKVACSLLLPRI